MKIKRGTFLPFGVLLFLSIFATVIISFLNWPEPQPADLAFITTASILVCLFSEYIFIRPRQFADKLVFQSLLIAFYVVILCLSLFFLFTVPGPSAPTWLPQVEVGLYSAAVSSLLSILFWYTASRQQAKEEYLFNEEWEKEHEEMKDKMSPLSPSTWLNAD